MGDYHVERSWELYDRSLGYLGCGSSTLSKAATHRSAEPPLIERGKGCRVWDCDGNEYIDFANALGPITLGHAVPEINRAIAAQLEDGIVFGRPHPLEGEVAEILCGLIPCAERVRFLKTGGEAIAACIKIARYATGRKRIVQCGYNGWVNTLSRLEGFVPSGVSSATPTAGIPSEISALHASLPWADIETWERMFTEHGSEIAAVVIAANYAEMEKGRDFLPAVRALTQRHGTVLVFDEIVTGFRLARAGAQEYFGVVPDLAVFAKGLANDMPLSAYVGKRELIESCRALGISSTFGGETLSLAAAKAVQKFYDTHDVVDYLWTAATSIWKGAEEIFRTSGVPIRMRGVPVCPMFEFGEGVSWDSFFTSACRNGLLLYSVPYTNWSHQLPDIEETLERLERAVREIA
jgi:glutamate-1-semialdehyde 2,1-aminomutase